MSPFKKLRQLFNPGRDTCRCDTYEPLRSPANTEDDLDQGAGDMHLYEKYHIANYAHGQYCVASVQADVDREDRDREEATLPDEGGMFVGIFDGHDGTKAAEFLYKELPGRFGSCFLESVSDGGVEQVNMGQVLSAAISQTENDFTNQALNSFDPSWRTVGSCCIVGVIWQGMLYVANLGDSRAVLGHYNLLEKICERQLTKEHNVNIRKVRKELRKEHRDDPYIVEKRGESWCVKGRIQVARTIGDVYLKHPNIQVQPEFQLRTPIINAVIRTDAEMFTKPITKNDNFLIFASEGLWKHLTNEEAVEIVHRNLRRGSAKRLIIKALLKAAQKEGRDYEYLKNLTDRRDYHHDITVVVVFFGNGPTGPIARIPAFQIKKSSSDVMDMFETNLEAIAKQHQQQHSWPFHKRSPPELPKARSG